jgi:hypothetical protein
MSKCSQTAQPGTLWEEDFLELVGGKDGSDPQKPVSGRAATEPAAEPDGQWLCWRKRLWRELALATALYGLAHALFGMRWVPDGLPQLSVDLLVAHSLFVLGTLLLAKVTQTLNEPIAARHPNGLKQAGSCLAITMLLCLSPCVWWLLSRM